MDGGAQPHQAQGLALALPPCPRDLRESWGLGSVSLALDTRGYQADSPGGRKGVA